MKRLIAAALAALVLGTAGAASAAPFYRHGPVVVHREVVRFAPRHHVWVRGERFTSVYGRPIFVNDWRLFRLRPPAFGYHWVRAGGDFLLVSDRTGFIADVIVARY